jgi:hypothetical protein
MIKERAVYIKYSKGIEETDRIHVEIPIEHFRQETTEFGPAKMTQFFMSEYFTKEFSIVDKQIKTVLEI